MRTKKATKKTKKTVDRIGQGGVDFEVMKRATDERLLNHFFKIQLNEAESERLNVYVRETGVKKVALIRKALLRYLDEQNS